MTFDVNGDPDTEYFNALGYTNSTQSAVIAPNYQGIGLPAYLWYQVINQFYNVDPNVSNDLLCNPAVGALCALRQTCSTYTSNLWNYSFKVQFDGQDNYINLPLSAFAVDNNGECDLYIQYLDSEQNSQSDQIILGSMFLQQYINGWDYDLTAGTVTYYAELSSSCTLTGAYIGNGAATAAASPFISLQGTTQTIYVNTNEKFQTTIGANLGYQGQKQFGVSLLGHYVQTFSADCLLKFGGQQFRSCETAPVYALNYFDNTTYYNDTNFYAAGGVYDGYDTTGNVYNSSVCVKVSTLDLFCTIQN
jgi:hypothetical protein